MKTIKLPSLQQKQKQRHNNIRMLKILIDQYVQVNKEEAINKIKSEQ